MNSTTRLEKYAKLAIRKGVNIQKGQILLINSSIEAVELTRACVAEAYQAGAAKVVVHYGDEQITKLNYAYQDIHMLAKVYPWQIDSKLDYFKEGACILHIISQIPGIYKDIDAEKIATQSQAIAKASKELQSFTMQNKTQWSIVAAANQQWADQVFDDVKGNRKALEKLWDAIFKCTHVEENNDPVQAWDELERRFDKRINKLNEWNFKTLHFKNELKTDLYVDLVRDHIWAGGSEKTIHNISFNPNIPTEEVFTMPCKTGVRGIVYASKPLLYNGVLIKDFSFTFKDGQVVDYDAKQGKEALKQLLSFDEGSKYLGEVALVPNDSAISQSNILFLNTLFDENASCHLALGDAYPMNLKNGIQMSEEQLKNAGANQSLTHVDFMFGSKEMEIIGIDEEGKETQIFVHGDFAFNH